MVKAVVIAGCLAIAAAVVVGVLYLREPTSDLPLASAPDREPAAETGDAGEAVSSPPSVRSSDGISTVARSGAGTAGPSGQTAVPADQRDAAPDSGAGASGEQAALPAAIAEPAEDDARDTGPAAVEAPATPSAEDGSEKAAAGGAGHAPSFDIVRVERSGETVIAGRAEPGSKVAVVADGRKIADAEADARGEWVAVPERPLPAGEHQLSLQASRPDRPEVAARESDDVVVVMVPESRRGSQAQVDEGDAGGEPRRGEEDSALPGPLAVLQPREGDGASQVLQAGDPPAGAPGEGVREGDLALETLDYDEEGRATVGGAAKPGTEVRVYLNNEPVGQARADARGRWQQSLPKPVDEGLQRLRVDQVQEEGEVVARVEVPFAPVRDASELTRPGSVVVQPGNSLWRLARHTYGRGIRYTMIFEANREQIRDPDLIYPGQVFVLPPENG